MSATAEPLGSNCANGGVKIQTMSGTQVIDTLYVCNGLVTCTPTTQRCNGSTPQIVRARALGWIKLRVVRLRQFAGTAIVIAS